ncbi:MAG: DUF1573 domain-containing protein [Marinoscillum sp.]
MKHLVILFLPLVLLVSTGLTAQDIQFVTYTAGECTKTLNEAEKLGASLAQPGATATEWNYGSIDQNATGYRFFKFTNTGTGPLVITSAKGSCGCTVPSYPKEPIMPGQSEYIKVKYDTKRVGAFTKYVTLTTNATSNTTTRLKIFGTVNAAAPASSESKSTFGGN